MTVSNAAIAETLDCYLSADPGRRAEVRLLLDALEAEIPHLSSRSTMPVHVTCSVAAINDLGQVLMVHHRTLGIWLVPGGHIDDADDGLVAAALREFSEETGIDPATVGLPTSDVTPVDVDLHHIPNNPRKSEGDHWHADFRFAFRISPSSIEIRQEEVTDHAWRSVSELQTDRLATRVGHHLGA